MTHTIQIGITLDDEAIIESVKRQAEKQIIANLEKEVEKSLFGTRYIYRNTNDPHAIFTQLAKDIFSEFLNANKEEILNHASVILADKLARSKAGKAILEDIQ